MMRREMKEAVRPTKFENLHELQENNITLDFSLANAENDIDQTKQTLDRSEFMVMRFQLKFLNYRTQ